MVLLKMSVNAGYKKKTLSCQICEVPYKQCIVFPKAEALRLLHSSLSSLSSRDIND